MKEFDEWWNNNQWKYNLSERSPCITARDGWEAALKWVYNNDDIADIADMENQIEKMLTGD